MGETITLPGTDVADGYLALPAGDAAPGVLVCHSWWGCTEFFIQLCDRLAIAGFAALAIDMYHGQTATAIEDARRLRDGLDATRVVSTIKAGAEYLGDHLVTHGRSLGALGVSMGAAFATLSSTLKPKQIRAVVLFYGTGQADYSQAQAAFLGHFAADDEWEPNDEVRRIERVIGGAGHDVTFHTYLGTQRWFFEKNQPGAYDPWAAQLAWERTISFLHLHLG